MMVVCIGMTGALRGQGPCKGLQTPKTITSQFQGDFHCLPKESLGW